MASRNLDPWPIVPLPTTAIAAPQLGFGCSDLYAGQSLEASVRLVRTAFETGLRYFDVARLYGDGSAETVLGEALSSVREQVVITTKAGIVPWSMQLGRRLNYKAATMLRRFGPASRKLVPQPRAPSERYGAFSTDDLTRSLHASLRALRTDYVDFLLLHECHLADVQPDKTRDLLERWRADGRIRGYGVATHFSDTLEILRNCPGAAPVAQFASDVVNRNAAHLSSRPKLVITHSALRYALPELRRRLNEDAELAVRWADATGHPATDSGTLARVLLSLAAGDNSAGLVLFSSSKPERIVEMAEGRFPASVLAAATDVVQQALI